MNDVGRVPEPGEQFWTFWCPVFHEEDAARARCQAETAHQHNPLDEVPWGLYPAAANVRRARETYEGIFWEAKGKTTKKTSAAWALWQQAIAEYEAGKAAREPHEEERIMGHSEATLMTV